MVHSRSKRWLDDLDRTLDDAAALVDRGRAAFDADAALPLAFEALCNRVGDLAKKLSSADAELFDSPLWRQAARTRDFVLHHYHRVDLDLLWSTVSESFPLLREAIVSARERP